MNGGDIALLVILFYLLLGCFLSAIECSYYSIGERDEDLPAVLFVCIFLWPIVLIVQLGLLIGRKLK